MAVDLIKAAHLVSFGSMNVATELITKDRGPYTNPLKESHLGSFHSVNLDQDFTLEGGRYAARVALVSDLVSRTAAIDECRVLHDTPYLANAAKKVAAFREDILAGRYDSLMDRAQFRDSYNNLEGAKKIAVVRAAVNRIVTETGILAELSRVFSANRLVEHINSSLDELSRSRSRSSFFGIGGGELAQVLVAELVKGNFAPLIPGAFDILLKSLRPQEAMFSLGIRRLLQGTMVLSFAGSGATLLGILGAAGMEAVNSFLLNRTAPNKELRTGYAAEVYGQMLIDAGEHLSLSYFGDPRILGRSAGFSLALRNLRLMGLGSDCPEPVLMICGHQSEIRRALECSAKLEVSDPERFKQLKAHHAVSLLQGFENRLAGLEILRQETLKFTGPQ